MSQYIMLIYQCSRLQSWERLLGSLDIFMHGKMK